jgi:hypothetical protein
VVDLHPGKGLGKPRGPVPTTSGTPTGSTTDTSMSGNSITGTVTGSRSGTTNGTTSAGRSPSTSTTDQVSTGAPGGESARRHGPGGRTLPGPRRSLSWWARSGRTR